MWNLWWDDCRTAVIQGFSSLKCKSVENIEHKTCTSTQGRENDSKGFRILAESLWWEARGSGSFIRSICSIKESWINRVGTNFYRSGELWNWRAVDLMGELRLSQGTPCKSVSVGLDGSTDLAGAQNFHHFSGFFIQQLGRACENMSSVLQTMFTSLTWLKKAPAHVFRSCWS